MKRYLVFILFSFIISVQGICGDNYIRINNPTTQYNYGNYVNLPMAISVVPNGFGSKIPVKARVNIVLPASMTWNTGYGANTTTSVVISPATFSSQTISFDCSNLYEGKSPQSTGFTFSVNNIYINTPTTPVCSNVNAQIVAKVSFYDADGVEIFPSDISSVTNTYAFTLLKQSTDIDILLYKYSDADYVNANDVFYVEFYYTSYSINPQLSDNISLESNLAIVKIEQIYDVESLPNENVPFTASSNVYSFSRDQSYNRRFFRVYIKPVTTVGTVDLTFKIKVTPVRVAGSCAEPGYEVSYNKSITSLVDASALYTYPRIQFQSTYVYSNICQPDFNVNFSVDNIYNNALNTNSYIEILNDKNTEFTGLNILSPSLSQYVNRVVFKYCSSTTLLTKTKNSSGVFDFSTVDKKQIEKIYLYFDSGIPANDFLNLTLSLKSTTVANQCGETNRLVFNLRRKDTDALLSSKTIGVSFDQNIANTQAQIYVSPYGKTVSPGETYSYILQYNPGKDDTPQYKISFPKNNHFDFDRSIQPQFSIDGVVFKSLLQFKADYGQGSLSYTYSGDLTKLIVTGVNLPPTLTGCQYTLKSIFVKIPVKVVSKPTNGTYWGYANLINNNNVDLSIGYPYYTNYNSDSKLNALLTASCDAGILNDTSITIKNNDAFSMQLTGENRSGNSYQETQILFTLSLPRSDVDFDHSSLLANVYTDNDVFKTALTAPSVVYISADNSEYTTIQPTSTKVRLSYTASLAAYEKIRIFLTFPGNKTYTNTVSMKFTFDIANLPVSSNLTNTYIGSKSDCEPISCSECITSFSPKAGKYVVSAWVKETFTGNSPGTYDHSGIKINFNNDAITNIPLFRPTGPVVDGWQRIEGVFEIPDIARNIQIVLVNEQTVEGIDVFFDDIRIHPFNSNMKSFVYDPSTQKLTAELDENNFATVYEYDDEGILIRVKKETERGVMTIKETRSNQSKVQSNKIK